MGWWQARSSLEGAVKMNRPNQTTLQMPENTKKVVETNKPKRISNEITTSNEEKVEQVESKKQK